VTIGFSRRLPGRCLAFLVPVLVTWLSGCQQSYPEDLIYPIRNDLLVEKAPSNEVQEPEPPGELDQTLEKLAQAARGKEGGGTFYDPRHVDAPDRRDLERVLNALYGTPAAPRVHLPSSFPEHGTYDAALAALMLDEGSLVEGSKLYRRHCLQCHGVPGDGRGPTGAWVNPHPRDFRQGKFKFISTRLIGRPSRDDLYRVIHNGIEGTAMPAFNTLNKEQLDQLVSYVIHLSLRGEVEYNTLLALLKKESGSARLFQMDGSDEGTVISHAQFMTFFLLTNTWYEANKPEKRFEPRAPEMTTESEEESVRRGFDAFLTKKKAIGGCIECHKDFGRQVAFRYDVWGTLVRPNNLTAGVYRGGRRPIDIYYRIRAGISPSTMTAVSSDDSKATEKDVWDLVNFVHALPYPAMLPADVRDKVYGQPPPVTK
jgi:mono/diheme cytochrome c family protein